MSLFFEYPWDSQPQKAAEIAYHKRSSAAIHAYAVASLGQQINGSPLAAYNDAIVVASPVGLAWDLSASTAYVDLGAVPTTTEGVSFVCVGRQNAAANFLWSTRTGSTTGFELLVGSGGAGNAQIRRNGNISTPQASGLNDGRFHAYAGSYDPVSLSFTVDGTYIGATSTNTTQAHAQNLFLGRRGTTYISGGQVALMVMFLRAMSVEEQIELTRTLESVYNNTLADRKIIIPVSAGGGPATHATTAALAGAGGTVAGTAAHIAIHGTTAALAGAGGAITGAAARTREHAATAALAGAGGAITGAADHTSPGIHDTTAALAGAGGAIAGTAAHIAIHGTTAGLAGAGGAITGTAARVAAAVTHDTTAALAGGGAVIGGLTINGTLISRKYPRRGRSRPRKVLPQDDIAAVSEQITREKEQLTEELASAQADLVSIRLMADNNVRRTEKIEELSGVISTLEHNIKVRQEEEVLMMLACMSLEL